MAEDKIQDFPVFCEGGLDSNQNHVELSSMKPGSAVTLRNFEPGLYGGYRKINGFAAYDSNHKEVDSAGAEGKILGISIYEDRIFADRKQQSGNTYEKYEYEGSTSGWVKETPGFTLNTLDTYEVKKVRSQIVNYGGGDVIIWVDGVNFPYFYDGSSYYQIKSTNSGNAIDHAGGDQALDRASCIALFQRHTFMSGDPEHPSVVAHSEPESIYGFKSAGGAGQIVVGFDVVQIKPWRDQLIVFGRNNIGRIYVEGSNFVYKDITGELGCIAPDSVVESDGDLIFLSQDGFRPISGTNKINDFELETISRSIQTLISENLQSAVLDDISSVVVRRKSQCRFFFNNSALPTSQTKGFLTGLRKKVDSSVAREWAELEGIQAYVACSGLINNEEVVLHGDYQGNVFRQESGNSFDGSNITAVYSTPYLDFSAPMIRKTLSGLAAFVRAEGNIDLTLSLKYNWNDPNAINPSSYSLVNNDLEEVVYGAPGVTYGSGVKYGGVNVPFRFVNVQGSGFSVQFTFSSSNTKSSYSIQTIIPELMVQGRR